MHALQLVAPRTYQRTAVPDPPDPPAPGRVVVRLETAAVCGSDMPFFTGHVPEPYPLAVGLSIHECIGRVVRSGSGRFRPGDRVLFLPERQHGLFEYSYLDEGRVFHLRRDAPPHHVLAQPLATVLWACRKLPPVLGKRAVVIGQGPIGLYFSRILANGGARQVIGIDRVPERVEAALRMGATAAVDAAREDPVQAVARLTGGHMAELVVEAVGHQVETVRLAVELAAHGGDILLFGVPERQEQAPFPLMQFFRKNLNLLASVDPDLEKYFPLAIDMVGRGAIDVTPLVTHHFSVAEINRAFSLVERRADGVLKPLITFDW